MDSVVLWWIKKCVDENADLAWKIKKVEKNVLFLAVKKGPAQAWLLLLF